MPYLSIIKDYGQRKLLSKYHLSEHDLCVETGQQKQSFGNIVNLADS